MPSSDVLLLLSVTAVAALTPSFASESNEESALRASTLSQGFELETPRGSGARGHMSPWLMSSQSQTQQSCLRLEAASKSTEEVILTHKSTWEPDSEDQI